MRLSPSRTPRATRPDALQGDQNGRPIQHDAAKERTKRMLLYWLLRAQASKGLRYQIEGLLRAGTMEEQIARLLAGIGILIWGVLALVNLFLEWRAGSSSPGLVSVRPSGQASESFHSRAV